MKNSWQSRLLRLTKQCCRNVKNLTEVGCDFSSGGKSALSLSISCNETRLTVLLAELNGTRHEIEINFTVRSNYPVCCNVPTDLNVGILINKCR